MMKSINMKNSRIRTCVAVILVAALLVTSSINYSYAATASSSETDTATMLLASMGVISADSAGSYNLSGTVTRAEFAKMLIMASSYKDMVNTTSYSSPYKDVPAKHWAAPYIKLAVSNGLMSGYSNGTFRPDSTITLEQGVNSALILLGYTSSDFTGAFPYAQMNVYGNAGLNENISGGVGTLMTKGDAANLIYNMMGTTLKDGSETYAENIGYSLNDSGEVDYAAIVSDNMNGPYTVKSGSWMSDLGLSDSGLVIYKNGSVAISSDIKTYDVLYYSQSKETVWAYDDKVTGIYESATPSQNAVTSVVVSGTEYTLESAAAFSALSSTGNLKIGSAVTLLLGKNGGVADAVSVSAFNESVVVYVTETGTKTYENSDGSSYSSKYIVGVKPNGTEIEYTVTESWINVGDVLNISFDSSGNMKISLATDGGKVNGTADADLNLIGIVSISDTATLIDTYDGSYTQVSMNRLDGVNIESEKILYYEASNGVVTALFMDDITGDAKKYGVVTYSSGSSSTSGTYKYLIDGVSGTLTGTLGAHGGASMFYGESSEITSIKNLYGITSKVKSFNSNSVVTTSDIGAYPVWANVSVYSKTSDSVYTTSTVSAALSAYSSGKTVSFYYDKEPSKGGCVRVIIYNQ